MKLTIDGFGDINVARSGPTGATPLVLLHPVGLDLTWWSAQIDGFRDRFDVVAVDMPGHGLSADLAGKPTFDRLAALVEQVMIRLDLRPAHIVGLSIGGMIAQTLVLRAPARVRSLALVGTACGFPDDVRDALRERARVARTEGMDTIATLAVARWFTADFRAARPDMMDRARMSLLHRDAAFHAEIWDMVAMLSTQAQLASVACPTLIVVGECDINTPPASARQLQGAIAGSRIESMADTGHLPPFERPEAFNRLLRSFLDDVEGIHGD
ncbi:MAG: alpha/beta fold hydrolase [Luteibacter sp.]